MSEQHLEELIDKLSGLKVVDLAKLKTLLEEKWGVKAAAAVAMVAGAGAAVEAQAEATEFHVMLTGVPADKKIGVIKIVREVTGLGLKEAMDLVAALPKALKENASKADAETLVKKIQDAGGSASIKPV